MIIFKQNDCSPFFCSPCLVIFQPISWSADGIGGKRATFSFKILTIKVIWEWILTSKVIWEWILTSKVIWEWKILTSKVIWEWKILISKVIWEWKILTSKVIWECMESLDLRISFITFYCFLSSTWNKKIMRCYSLNFGDWKLVPVCKMILLKWQYS